MPSDPLRHQSSGRYRTIVADPPWQYTKAKLDTYAPGTAEGEYDTLTVQQIAALPIAELAADDAHLYMWVTNPILTEQRTDGSALDVMRAWGFVPKTVLTWVKGTGGGGLGWYFRGDTEHVLFGVRGTLPIPPASRRSNVLMAPKGQHSAKPDAFLDLVEQVSPGPYVELFARRARFGWDYAGDGGLGTVDIPGLRAPDEQEAA